MAKYKNIQEDSPDGAPDWMVTFSDCMTLLLTFFVLLLSFSTFDDKAFDQPRESLSAAFSSVSTARVVEEAVIERDQIEHFQKPKTGAEKPTDTKGEQDNSLEELDPIEFDHHKIFMFTSQTFFYGNGTVISAAGIKNLNELAKVLKKSPNRIMICEYSGNSDSLGIARAQAVSNYLTRKSIKKDKICISTTGIYPKNNAAKNARAIEIAVLNQSIFQ
ncbi:MAG: OmpA family protein [Anaerohalosphaera sp.]|nr:OmpA family protein [Anaerohalosphaera sp.]